MEGILQSMGREDLLGLFASDVSENSDEIDRRVQENLTKWQSGDKPLAPLNDAKLEVIYQMREALNVKYFTGTSKNDVTESRKSEKVDNYRDFLEKFIATEKEIDKESQYQCDWHKNYLQEQKFECQKLLNAVNIISTDLSHLGDNYNHVAMKINSLHNVSEQLMRQQMLLKEKKQQINERLVHFTKYAQLSHSVATQSHKYNSDTFLHNVLEEINTSLEYLEKNIEFKEAFSYKLRYEQLLSTCLGNVVRYVNAILSEATRQVALNTETSKVKISMPASSDPNVETAFSYYYGKFQNAATKTSNVIAYVEERTDVNDSYEHTLLDFNKSYFSLRAPIMQAAVSKALLDLRDKYRLAKDHGVLFRSAALFTIKVCQDEGACYHYFFRQPSQQLSDYLNAICQNLYDVLRPCLIGINHIEVLTELATILKEMIAANGQNPSVGQFADIINQLVQDVEERLVFRTNIFFQYDISGYQPSPGDLAYPEKLEQMEDVAEELAERRSASRTSSTSSFSAESLEVAGFNAGSVGQFRSFTGNSPADLHGMWYPTVKRTLVCLSRLYICLDRETFQGVAQEGLLICVQTIDKAGQLITARKSTLDGRLFQIKHLLIMREQIAPFQVDFTITELGFDFSHVRSAAVGLVHNRDKIFTLGTNNAILEFLLEGTPRVKEYLVDSRKEIDKALKLACENFIADTTSLLIGPLQQFLHKGEYQLGLQEKFKDSSFVPLREQLSSTPQVLAGIVAGLQRNVKGKIPDIQRAMRLYLANRETEFILFRPVKNNIMNAFIQLDQFMQAAKYTSDDLLLIGLPTVEQLNVLISSVSLAAADGINKDKK